MPKMRAAFLVHVSAAESGEGQANGWDGLTTMNSDEPDDLDDDEDDDDDDVIDDGEDGEHDDENGWEDEDDDEPETWQVTARALGRAVALPRITPTAAAKRP